jgi:four helix bundle protein
MKRFLALDLAVELYKACEALKLKNPIRDQFQRASLSVALNITEGSGRSSLKDKKRFYAIALGSVRECQCLSKIIGNKMLIEKYDKLGGLVYGLNQIT